MFQVQPAQHVYSPQVQYVEGGDAIYANGALYVPSSPLQTAPGHVGTFPPPTPSLHLGTCLHKPLSSPLDDMLERRQWQSGLRALWRFQKSHTFVVFTPRKFSLKQTLIQLLSVKCQASQSTNRFHLCFLILAFVNLQLCMMSQRLDLPLVKGF